MTDNPTPGRNRRTQRNERPEDVLPQSRPRRVQAARQPIGRSADLQARQEEIRRSSAARQTASGTRLPLYSDFDDPVAAPRTYDPRSSARSGSTIRNGSSHRSGSVSRPAPRRHTALWLFVAVFCLMCTGVLGLLVAPQLIGVSWQGMPNFAFVNGSVIREDADTIRAFRNYREVMATDTIHNGVYIDGIHVGGMTKAQAIEAVGIAPGNAGSEFAIQIIVQGNVWSVDSGNIPLYRNTEELVALAYAVGRSNTTAIRGTGVTPFRQRLNTVQSVWQTPVAYYTQTTYDHAAVRELVDDIALEVNREPINASVAQFDQSSKTFTFDADVSGVYISADDIYNAVVARLDGGVYYDTLQVEPQIILADVTKAELMNSFGLISSYTTKTTSNRNRNTNIDLAAQAINGRTVLPGETFSFNQATGQRTEAKGYKPASALGGGETFDEIGGGVCQTSTTLFNAVARANLTITDRDPHAWPSTYVPRGEDATVNWPNLDFRFRNDTDWPIFLVSWYSDRNVTVEVYGMSLGDGVTIDLESETTYTKKPPSDPLYVQNPELPFGTQKTTVKPRTGYTVETYKVWYRNGQEFQREKLHTSHYKMYQETIEWN